MAACEAPHRVLLAQHNELNTMDVKEPSLAGCARAEPVAIGQTGRKREHSPAPSARENASDFKRTRGSSLLVVSMAVGALGVKAERVPFDDEASASIALAAVPSMHGSVAFSRLALTPAADFTNEIVVAQEEDGTVHLFHATPVAAERWSADTRVADLPFAMSSGMIGVCHERNVRRLAQMFVKTITNNTLTIDVYMEDTLDEFKAKIEKMSGIPVDYQRLIYGGQQLVGSKTFIENKIPAESTMHLVLMLRGGMMHSTSGRSDLKDLPYPNLLHLCRGDGRCFLTTSMDAEVASLDLPLGYVLRHDGHWLHPAAMTVREWFPHLKQGVAWEYMDMRPEDVNSSWLKVQSTRLVGPLPTDTTWKLIDVRDNQGPAKMYVPADATPEYIKTAWNQPQVRRQSVAAAAPAGRFVRARSDHV